MACRNRWREEGLLLLNWLHRLNYLLLVSDSTGSVSSGGSALSVRVPAVNGLLPELSLLL